MSFRLVFNSFMNSFCHFSETVSVQHACTKRISTQFLRYIPLVEQNWMNHDKTNNYPFMPCKHPRVSSFHKPQCVSHILTLPQAMWTSECNQNAMLLKTIHILLASQTIVRFSAISTLLKKRVLVMWCTMCHACAHVYISRILVRKVWTSGPQQIRPPPAIVTTDTIFCPTRIHSHL